MVGVQAGHLTFLPLVQLPTWPPEGSLPANSEPFALPVLALFFALTYLSGHYPGLSHFFRVTGEM
jgi:hypothetical protein